MQRQRKNQQSYFRQIDFVFYNEENIREAVLQARISSGKNSGIVAVAESGFSDPTASQAIKNLTLLPYVMIMGEHMIKKPEHWLTVIDKTYNWCKIQKDKRYEVARRRYTDEDYRKTCHDLHISNSTRRRLLELVQMYAALQAVQLGLIQV